MELLVLGLVLLARNLVTSEPECPQDDPTIEEVALDMAPNSFDDQYEGCNDTMQEELKELNRTEMAKNSVYNQAWTNATAKWWKQQNLIPRTLRPEQAIALLVYTLECPLYEKFNAAVREAGRSREEYLNDFNYKSLHFLLSEALRALRNAQCRRVYRGVSGICFTAKRGQSMRFGHFTSTSLQKQKAMKFGRDTIFYVKTCYGAVIRSFSFFKGEEEVLIPPWEVFNVTDITHEGNSRVIHLLSQTVYSKYNCEFVKGKECKSQACVSRAGRSIPADLPHLWGLLLAATVLAAGGSP